GTALHAAVCEAIAGADAHRTLARYKARHVCVALCHVAPWLASALRSPSTAGALSLGDTPAAVNRSIIAGGTEPPASFHVRKRRRSPFSAHISGVSHDDACLPEPTNAPRAAPAPRSQPWHVRCADRWIWHRRRAVLLRVAADEAARGRRAGLL